MSLTHIQISHAKPKAKAYKMADADALYLVVTPTGAKVWRMNYRYLGRQKTLYFGSWPDVGIANARELRDAARRKLIAGLVGRARAGAQGGRIFFDTQSIWAGYADRRRTVTERPNFDQYNST